MAHKYKLAYELSFKTGEFTAEEHEKEKVGLTDALLFFSLIYPEDGSFSTVFTSVDGRTGKEISDHEVFKVWTIMAKRLKESAELSEGQKYMAGQVWDTINRVLQGESKKGEEPEKRLGPPEETA